MVKASVASRINRQYFKPSFRRKIRSSSTPLHSPFIALTIRHRVTSISTTKLRTYHHPPPSDFSHFCLLGRPSGRNVLAWQINKRPRNKLTPFLFRHQPLRPYRYRPTRASRSLPLSYTFFLLLALFPLLIVSRRYILSLLKVYSLSEQISCTIRRLL